jgi:hypothetical protein
MASELGCSSQALEVAESKLDAIALTLADARLPGQPDAELIETGRVLDEWLTSDEQTDHLRGDFADLLLPSVLAEGHGDESVVVAAALAACDRAGLRFGVVASDKHLYLVHHDLTQPYVLAPRFGWRFVEATDLSEGDLRWLCPHELAMRALDAIHARASICNRVDIRLTASKLRADMPMDARTHDAHQTELAMARARFN